MPEINHRTYIKVPKEKIYHILLAPEGWNAWFTDDTTIEMKSNGTGDIRLRWTNFGKERVNIEDGGKILEVIPNQKFVFQWSPGETTTTVSFTLETYKEGTLVTLNESGYSDSVKDLKACIGCAVGWGESLMLLKMYLEHGIVCKQDL